MPRLGHVAEIIMVLVFGCAAECELHELIFTKEETDVKKLFKLQASAESVTSYITASP